MDDKLNKALEFANHIYTLENQKNIIQEQFLQSLAVYENNSKISLNQQLISYLYSLVQSGYTQAVILDDFDMPVKLNNLVVFYENSARKYQEALTQYEKEYAKLLTEKNIRNMAGLDD